LFTTLIAMTAMMMQTVPPTKVLQTDGTIQLVPVPPAVVYTPYFIDPTMQYKLTLNCQWANGAQLAFKDTVITAEILASPYPKTKVVDGKTVYLYSIYRSADAVVEYDHTRLELLPSNNISYFGFDTSTMDVTKTKYTNLGDGLVLVHAEALKAPELRTPPLAPRYYMWNFDGLLWPSASRSLARLEFKVKDNYYLPTWGSQKSFIRLLQSTDTKVDGSPTIGTNVLKDVVSKGDGIIFGAPASSKVSHYLSAPATKFKVGDTVQVQVMIKPDTLPQLISSVATNFAWDPAVLEFTGLDNTGIEPNQSSRIERPAADSINELPIPKDGNAFHAWMSVLGSKKYIDKETVVGKLNFKVVADFATTSIDIVKKNDPRLIGLVVPEESRPIGSNQYGYSILSNQNGTTINGVK